MPFAQWQLDYAQLAWLAEASGGGLSPVTALYPDCTVSQAYEIQRFNVSRQRKNGRAPAGYKVGLTTPAGQKKYKTEQPMYGCLFRDMVWENGCCVDASTLNFPQLEVEIAFTVSRNVDFTLHTIKDAAACIKDAHIAFEVVSGRLAAPAACAADLIADNAVARGIVLGEGIGDPDKLEALAEAQITLFRKDKELQRVPGKNISGDPLCSVIWLANALLASGQQLGKGNIVMAGSATSAVAISAGDVFTASCPELGEVTARF